MTRNINKLVRFQKTLSSFQIKLHKGVFLRKNGRINILSDHNVGIDN